MRQLDPPFTLDNLNKVLFEAPPRLWHDGLTWYEQAHDWCVVKASEHGYTVQQTAAVVATLSRNTPWDKNLIYAENVLSGRPQGHFAPCLAQCKAVLAGSPPLEVLTGPKIRAFYSNIADPLGSEAVTIDRHAAACLAGMKTIPFIHAYKSAMDNRRALLRCTEIYTRAARERGILPHQAQAVSWLQHRETQ